MTLLITPDWPARLPRKQRRAKMRLAAKSGDVPLPSASAAFRFLQSFHGAVTTSLPARFNACITRLEARECMLNKTRCTNRFYALVGTAICLGALPTACAGHRPTTAQPEVAPERVIDPVSCLDPQTRAMLWIDLDGLRHTSTGALLNRWLHAAVEHEVPSDSRAKFDAILDYIDATDGVWGGMVPGPANGEPDFVCASRGHYTDGDVDAWSAILGQVPGFERGTLSGRPMMRSERDDLLVWSADSRTMVWADRGSVDRIVRIARGELPVESAPRPLGVLGQEAGFGTHTMDFAALPSGRDEVSALILSWLVDRRVETITVQLTMGPQIQLTGAARFRAPVLAEEYTQKWRVELAGAAAALTQDDGLELAAALRSLASSATVNGATVRARTTLADEVLDRALMHFVRDASPDLAAGVTGAPIADAASDLALVCRVMSESSDADPAQRAAEMAQRLDRELTNPGVREAFEALAGADPEERYRILQAMAAELGVPDYACPAMEASLNP